MNSKHAYTIAEVTRITGSSRTTIYAEIAAQRLTAKKLGRRTLILADDLRTWLNSLPAIKTQAA
ncbi:helix-turn-helix domain-containing protein [Methylobacterium durans]|uniref:DNA-binding protein n=1 Tax=Methylobacterium durans TaxID=2202825 RepID=A0A2U8W416_9HYPH|nr:helix-turn-helix domain-containing protein [Methylobacterium durans]AWN40260.1 DNA-binding protein [Methylobacterium durans]